MWAYIENKVLESFTDYMKVWKNRNLKELKKMIDPDIHAYLSCCKYTPDCSQHSLYGMYDFISTMPKTDDFNFEITNFICRINEDKIHQYAEVACIASNGNGENFKFVSTFVNVWKWINEEIKIIEMRLDINPIGGKLFDYYKETWLFEPEFAILSGSVHLPCIFPEMDSPYQYGIGNMGDINEVIKRYFYGVDQLHFIHVKDVIDDDFIGGKYQYIVKEKFLRQRYRYASHPYSIQNIEYENDYATVFMTSILDTFKPLKFRLRKNNEEWKIIDIKEI